MAKIVLVDDHTLLRNGLAGLIESLGHKILFEANHGKEFIQKLEHSRELPDMVLLDINMPEVSGIDLLEFLRLREDLRSIPVVMLSSETTDRQVDEALGLGADAFVFKPVTIEELEGAIERAFLAHRGGSNTQAL